ncbi:glycine zipper 2TM domain-containing protein [Herbaspirillum sp. RTI4]|uniref:glycine zipper 2TM domain-containing protein n=1 Tax=Herbaspirillum sp. RTI4 TaxID=3048640 RepID=UPI002AB369DA|nr:glycine zipper 2TM domain-containing protein [Herbaspirillum sp. RTI4]MDY7579217.1 glycine zipper 2TM domain-containing protein [Herbaspirillum sp. RTI4]MEA9982650.1 glycine zipper 2TM domain-containing protein [Herbaspirillum sp. RTI4]
MADQNDFSSSADNKAHTAAAQAPVLSSAKRIHPLLAGAAVAIILVSLTGVAAITGLIPNSHSTAGPEKPLADNRATGTPAAPGAPLYSSAGYDAPAAPPVAPMCNSCGQVESVNAVQHQVPTSGVGVGVGAVVGGVLGNQVGNGVGRTLATVAGAVGGGYAGNEVERRTHTTTVYDVSVRMENGRLRTFPESAGNWHIGDPVRVVDGRLRSRG